MTRQWNVIKVKKFRSSKTCSGMAGVNEKSHTTSVIGPLYRTTAIDPLLVSRFALGRAVAVGGKCRPIRLLSGAVSLYASTVNLPWRTAYLHTRICRDTICDLTFVCPPTCPLPWKQLWQTLLPGLHQGRYGGQMSAVVMFGNTCPERGQMPSTHYVLTPLRFY